MTKQPSVLWEDWHWSGSPVRSQLLEERSEQRVTQVAETLFQRQCGKRPDSQRSWEPSERHWTRHSLFRAENSQWPNCAVPHAASLVPVQRWMQGEEPAVAGRSLQ